MKERREKRSFVNGCFDILHVGHVRLLRYAATLGELTVAINSDASVKRLKGPNRPVFSQDERAEILGALSCVAQVIIFEEPTPTQLLKRLYATKQGPDYVVKGSEYRYAILPEREVIDGGGGTIMMMTQINDRSTTRVIKTLNKMSKSKKTSLEKSLENSERYEQLTILKRERKRRIK